MAVYVRPGAYTNFIETAGSVILGAGTRIPAIIATSYTYKTASQIIQKGAGYPTAPSEALTYASQFLAILSVGDLPYTSDYTEGVDFNVVNGYITWITGGSSPVAESKYYVRYTYSKASADYAAKLLYSKNAAQTEYGDERSDNPMSIALSIWNENGPFPVIAVQATANTSVAFKAAIDKLKYEIEGADPTHLVALTTDSEIHTYLYNHCLSMSSQFTRKERRALISTAINTSDASMKAKALALAYERIIYVPQWGVRTVPTSDIATADFTLDGTYKAIAVLGQMLSRNIEESITNKPISGFKTLTKVYLEEEADALAEKGILLLYTKGGIVKVRHDITTSVATPEENQWSVGEIKDYVAKNVRDVLEKQWLSKPIYGTETVTNVQATAEATLERLIEARIITNYNNVTAIQNAGDSRRIDVTFNFRAVYPLIWLYINFSFIKN